MILFYDHNICEGVIYIFILFILGATVQHRTVIKKRYYLLIKCLYISYINCIKNIIVLFKCCQQNLSTYQTARRD